MGKQFLGGFTMKKNNGVLAAVLVLTALFTFGLTACSSTGGSTETDQSQTEQARMRRARTIMVEMMIKRYGPQPLSSWSSSSIQNTLDDLLEDGAISQAEHQQLLKEFAPSQTAEAIAQAEAEAAAKAKAEADAKAEAEARAAEERARLMPQWNTQDFGGGAAIAQTFTVTNDDEWTTAIRAIDGGGNNKNYVINVSAQRIRGVTFNRVHSGVKIALRGNGTNSVGSPFNKLEGDSLILRDIELGDITVGPGTTLTMKSGSQAEKVRVDARGTFIMEDGKIKTAAVSGGTFTMNGGAITNNRSEGSVTVLVSDGTFTMNGGTITEDGVSVEDKGTFVMNGGTITGNKRFGVHMSEYGDFMYSRTFTMNGGTITGNDVGVVVSCGNGIFTMEGGEISGNRQGGVRMNRGTFTMRGGTIAGDQGRSLEVATGYGNNKAVYGNGANILEGYRVNYIEDTITGKR
ncbi:hypothetical protein FACS189483_03020 [Spirochaetia bacterium]|nr:hypothetical protein FACS189483_03020 [Spirochaetia bacterium]